MGKNSGIWKTDCLHNSIFFCEQLAIIKNEEDEENVGI